MLRVCVASTLAFGQVVGPAGAPQQTQVEPNGQAPDMKFRPVTRVINLLKDMQNTVQKEKKNDEDLYEKMQCWCKKNEGAKTKAIEEYKAYIERLTADIERFTAKAAQLTQEIKNLEQEIAHSHSSLRKATNIREDEATAFAAEKSDILETIDALEKALKALSGVHGEGDNEAAQESLMQLREHIKHVSRTSPSMFRDIAEKDLWDALGAIDGDATPKKLTATQVLSEVFMAPVKKHEDTKLMQAPTGAVAAKSYNARSGQIYGMLKEMNDEFNRKLTAAEKEEQAARETFRKLKASLLKQIAAANKAKNNKSGELATTNQSNAQAKQNLTNTRESLSEDEKFLVNLMDRCETSDKEYNARQKTRAEEIVAINETITILSEDNFRETANRTLNFVELTSKQSMRYKAADVLRQMARKHNDFNLAQLAVSLKLDGFERVKKAMNEMLAGLKQQQQDEFEHRDWCIKELDTNEDGIADSNRYKEDVESEIQDLENFVSKTKSEIKNLNDQINTLNVELKRASEDRAAENKEFTSTISDQRATKEILNKALVRLEQFYTPDKANQLAAASQPNRVQGALLQSENRPGFSVGNEAAPAQANYEKHGSAPGVLGMLREIIADADRMEAEATLDEQSAQKGYEEFTRNTNESVLSHQNTIVSKQGDLAKAEVALASNKDDLSNTIDKLEKLTELNGNLHKSCDFVMKNFEIRQTARAEEMESIQQAHAILSGSK